MKTAHLFMLLAVLLVVGLAALFFAGTKGQVDSNGYTDDDFDVTIETTTPNDTITMGETTTATLKTNKGDMTVELYSEKVPKTVENFVTLAQQGFYDGVKFHRVIPNFMIQTGDPLSKDDSLQGQWGTGGPGYKFEDEIVAGLSNEPGTLSMANAGPNTNGSQFFINVADNNFLDGKHAVFGKVVDGYEVAEAIANVPRSPGDVPNEPIIINSIVIAE